MNRVIKLLIISIALPMVFSCNYQNDVGQTFKKIASEKSQDGCCLAEIFESELGNSSITQVVVSIISSSCGSGAVSANGINLGLSVQWRDSNTLIVSYPKGLELTRNASGEWLQCGKYRTQVIIEPKSA